MKTILFSVLILFSPLLSYGKGGGMASGGGSTVVCRDTNGKIQSAELLDLYEGTATGFKMQTSTGVFEEDYRNAVIKTYALQGFKSQVSSLQPYLDEFMKRVHFTEAGKKLSKIDDLGNLLVTSFPPGCGLEQLALFYDGDNESIELDSEIWGNLNSLHKAALVHHELFYKAARYLAKETNSEYSRRLTALVYSQDSGVPVHDGLKLDRVQTCFTSESIDWVPTLDSSKNTIFNQAKRSHFAVSKNGNGIVLQFFELMGRPILSKMTATLPDLAWNLKRIPTQYEMVADSTSLGSVRVPLVGALVKTWELELTSIKNEKVELKLFDGNKLLGEAFISSCQGQSLL